MRYGFVVCGVVAAFLSAPAASAQSIGTFKWQLLPYCNVVSLTVVQIGGIYTLSGTDDQCGSPSEKASVAGTAFQNPSGTIGMGLAVVTAPGGKPVHIDATISLGSLSGTWRDSEGNIGQYIFTPLAGIPGPARPAPTGAVAPGSITSVHIATAAVGATQLAPGAVTAGSIADGSITGVKIADGTITAVKIGDRARAAFVSGEQDLLISTAGAVVRSLSLTVPSAGKLVVMATGTFGGLSEFPETVRCSLATNEAVDSSHELKYAETGSSTLGAVPFALTRGFEVVAGLFTVNLYCVQDSLYSVRVSDSSLTAQFFPVP